MSNIKTAIHPTQGLTDEPKIEVLDKEGNQWRLALYLWHETAMLSVDRPLPSDPPDIRLEHICPETKYTWQWASLVLGCVKCGVPPEGMMEKYRLLKGDEDDEPEELQAKMILTATELAYLGNHKPHNGVRITGVNQATKTITVEGTKILRDQIENPFGRPVLKDILGPTIAGPNGRPISPSWAIANLSSKTFPAWNPDDFNLIATDKAMPKDIKRLNLTGKEYLGMFPAWMWMAEDSWIE